jgi:N-methylhydantoinase A
VSLRLTAIGRAPGLHLARPKRTTRAAKPRAKRRVYFFDGGFTPTAIYERSQLRSGQELTGPCLIEEATSTTVVPPHFSCAVDSYGSLLIEPVQRSSPARSKPRRGLESRPARTQK